jgi:hypothetical protein
MHMNTTMNINRYIKMYMYQYIDINMKINIGMDRAKA